MGRRLLCEDLMLLYAELKVREGSSISYKVSDSTHEVGHRCGMLKGFGDG